MGISKVTRISLLVKKTLRRTIKSTTAPHISSPLIRPFPREIVAYKIMKLNRDGTLSCEVMDFGNRYNIGDTIYQITPHAGVHAYRTLNVAIEILNDKPAQYQHCFEHEGHAVVKVKLINPFVAGAGLIHYYKRDNRLVNVVAGGAAEILEIITDNRNYPK